MTPQQLQAGERVSVRGVVTYYDTFWRSMYLQDEQSAVHVQFFRTDVQIAPGSRVEVTAIPRPHASTVGVSLTEAIIREVEPAALPAARDCTLEQARLPENLAFLLRVEGVVQQIERTTANRWSMTLREPGGTIQCFFRDALPETVRPQQLLDAKVSVRCVAQPSSPLRPSPNQTVLMIHDFRDMAVLQPAPPDRFAAPAVPINCLSPEVRHAVRIRGRVADPRNAQFTLRDDAGQVDVVQVPRAWVRAGEEVDVVGFATELNHRPCFVPVDVRLQLPTRDGSAGRTLFEPGQVCALSPAEVAQGLPVRMRGVVTHYSSRQQDLFVQEGAQGIYVNRCPDLIPTQKRVEIEGHVAAGDFFPVVQATRVRALGDSTPIAPTPVSIYDVQTGRLDCMLVEVEGVVHRVGEWEKHTALTLMTRLGYVDVCVSDGTPQQCEGLLDARVRVQGVYSVIPNKLGQATGFRLFASTLAQVETQRAPPADPFATPVASMRRLLTYQGERAEPHRVRVAGRVTGLSPDGSLHLQDAEGSLRVAPQFPQSLAPGDAVEAAGFLALDRFAPRLDNALVRRSPQADSNHPLRVEPLDLAAALDGSLDGHLVRFDARFLSHHPEPQTEVLRVQHGEAFFEVDLYRAAAAGVDWPALEPGSELSITGICVIAGDRVGGPRSFRVEASRPDAIEVLRRPGWWTLTRMIWFCGCAVSVLALALVWVGLLRRQVRRQTRQIRERLEREARLQARYQDLCEHARDVIFTVDAGGVITSFNAAGEQVTGYPRARVLGTRLQDYILPGESEKLSESIHPGAAPFELNLRRADGQPATLELSVRPMPADGEWGGFQCIARDVTARKQMEERLRQSAKMEAIGQLAGGIAHDFNNLLTVINGFSEVLLAELPAGDPSFEAVREIAKAGERAAGLTRQLLAFGRRSIVAPKLLSLNDTVQDMEKMLRRILGETTALRTDLDPHLRLARLDAGLVGQVLLNLVVNAHDAMPGGGTVTLRTANLGDDWVRLTVTDTGCGMDAATRRRVFEPYFTTKPQGRGTGLGLATVFGIVETSGGRIDFDSEVGRGTSFTIDFPVAEHPAPGADEPDLLPPPAPEPPAGRGTILLVEDDPDVRTLEQHVLQSSGYRVLVAPGGAEALAILDEHREPVDLLITDVVMPEMNGRELSERARLRFPTLEVLFLSGYTDDAILRTGLLAEHGNFLQKPFKPQELLRKVRTILCGEMV